MIIADTDVLIDYLADNDPGAGRVAEELREGTLWTTVISQFEILSGARRLEQERTIAELLEGLAILPLDEKAARSGAQVRRTLERKGVTIGMADSLIAGITLATRGSLLTRNRRHFERVEGLVLVQF